MSSLRRWADPIDPTQAERLFSRFVRQVTRQLREPPEDPTTVVTSPNRPPRRGDEATATIRTNMDERTVDEIRQRRLLGQSELDATLDERDRKKLLVELTALYRHGHIDDVVVEIEKVRSKYPNDVELQGTLADFFLERGDLPRAIDQLFLMVNIYFERADVDAAKRCLERVRGLEPENLRLKKFERLLQP